MDPIGPFFIDVLGYIARVYDEPLHDRASYGGRGIEAIVRAPYGELRSEVRCDARALPSGEIQIVQDPRSDAIPILHADTYGIAPVISSVHGFALAGELSKYFIQARIPYRIGFDHPATQNLARSIDLSGRNKDSYAELYAACSFALSPGRSRLLS